jgi:hypothetical protein
LQGLFVQHFRLQPFDAADDDDGCSCAVGRQGRVTADTFCSCSFAVQTDPHASFTPASVGLHCDPQCASSQVRAGQDRRDPRTNSGESPNKRQEGTNC